MRYFAFPAPKILQADGRDAPRYMNARLTQDCKRLDTKKGCLAAALSAQGRCMGFFAVYRLGDNTFELHCDSGESAGVVSSFKQFLVADRVVVSELSDKYRLLHLLCGNEELKTALKPVLSLDGINLDLSSEHEFACCEDALIARRTRTSASGFDIRLANEQYQHLTDSLRRTGAVEISEDDYRFERISAGVPSFPEEINPETLFSECGVRGAVSFSKGCYVGQEVVEKIDAMGKTPRVLRVLRFASFALEIRKGAEILTALKSSDGEDENAVAGKVITAAHNRADNMSVCFASLKNLTDCEPGNQVLCCGIRGEIGEVRPW